MKKIWIIIVAAVVLAIGTGVLVIVLLQGNKYKNDVMELCRYSIGGGMLGGRHSMELKRVDDGAILTVTSQETHADREVTTVYTVDPGAFDAIREIVNRYNLYGASKRTYSKEQALDGDTATWQFRYAGGSFRISDSQALTRKMQEGVSEVRRYLGTLTQGEGVTTVEPQQARLYLRSGYTLTFFVADAFDGKLEDSLSEETEVSKFEESGIVLRTDDGLDTSAAEPVASAGPGAIVYDPQSGRIILLYDAYTFDTPVYLLAEIDDAYDSTWPLIKEMEGAYRMYFN